MSTLSASETKSLLSISLLLFRGKFWDFDNVHIHGIEVFVFWREGKGLKGLSGSSTVLDDLISLVLLILEMSGLCVPLVNFHEYRVEGHNLLHERDGDPSSKEADENIVTNDTSMDDIPLEDENTTFE